METDIEKRNWDDWLAKHLTFPFQVKRVDVDDYSFFHGTSDNEPFGLGHVMKVIGVDLEDDLYGIIFKVREGRRIAHVPLLDLEVLDKNDENSKYLQAYIDWFSENH